MSEPPWLTIVTVTRNDCAGLRRTWASMLGQTCSDWEWVVVDGASTDGTVEWLAANPHPRRRVLSEPDKGIYDAMNKGLALARGHLVLFLNAGDALASPTVLADVSAHQSPDLTALVGAVRAVPQGQAPDPARHPVTSPRRPLSWRRLRRGKDYLPHPASFVSRTELLAVGGFDRSFGVAADQLTLLRVAQRRMPVLVDVVVTDFQLGGASAGRSPWAIASDWHRMRVLLGEPLGGNCAVDRTAGRLLALSRLVTDSARAHLARRVPRRLRSIHPSASADDSVLR